MGRDVKKINNNTKFENYIVKQIEDLLPGDIILHPIYRLDGLMLIDKYKILSSDLISKIKMHASNDISVLVSPSGTKFKSFINNKEFNEMHFKSNLRGIVSEYNKIITFPINIDSLIKDEDIKDYRECKERSKIKIENDNLKIFYDNPFFASFETKLESKKSQERAKVIKLKLINTILNNNNLRSLLEKLKGYKDILFLHSINTASMALMIGLTLELQDEELIDLALAAMFSDIGYTEIEKEEFEKYLKNPEKEEQVLINQMEAFMKVSLHSPSLRKDLIIYGVLDRHEYYDGTGRPKGKKGKDISLFGRILSICQAYDVLVGGYLYNDGVSISKAIKILGEKKGKKFDPDILSIFIQRSTFWKIGERIILNDRLKGEIVGFSNYIEAPHLPIIKMDSGKIVNLLNITNFKESTKKL
ncbi:HD-GYP domain-containing protein [Oceanirhabdus sp. W0125-5]|uniref:HD-GYP domain-containing protein n=1 Tax=Oceanirhabdus sp. W0125-5 TaxID=2999116 RepID=UPI0022F2D906|nr:HD domain-containing phosphohydrolase [Oceanirhabdus sp. W0125-5]WBW95658.1 hypothetical protein OW730_18440 [Oceanirhabdus sp. W0125-5]